MATSIESAVTRALQAHCQLVGEPTSLDWGIAYVSERFGGLDEANQFREVIIERPEDIPTAYAAVDAHFGEKGLKCRRWSPALDQPVEALGSFLAERGFVREDYAVLAVREWVNLPTPEGVRVLPARAMRRAYDAILEQMFSPDGGAAADAARERLNDHRTDGVVATVDGEPAGCCSLFEVGDIGLVTDVFVLPSFRRRGVGTAMMGHVLKLARRLQLRVTCARALRGVEGATDFLTKCGMAEGGCLVEFAAPSDGASD